MRQTMIRSAILAIAGSISLSAHAIADDARRPIRIPASDLSVALELLAKQSGSDLVYRPDQVQGFRTDGVEGELSTGEAVTKLLQGTPLTLSLDSTGAMLIALPTPSEVKQRPQASMHSGGTKSIWSRLRLAQAEDQVRSSGAMTTQERARQSPIADSAALSRDTAVEEIIVTAQKRSESIQEVPTSVSVVSKAFLESVHATQLTDVGAYVPGLQIASGGTPGQATIIIRGVAPQGPGATVGTYIDDSPVGGSSGYARNTSFALDLLPYDVQRMEVLRGPQGTLYGASTMGGLLKYVLTQPTVSGFQARVGADGFAIEDASGPGWGARAMINAPLVQDRLGLLMSYARNNTPGYVDNVQTGQRDQNDVDQESARATLLWRPSEQFSLTLGILHQETSADGVGQVALTPTRPTPLLVAGELEGNSYVGESFDKRIDYQSLTLNWDLGWADFTSATSYTDTSTSQETDVTRTYGQLYPLFGSPAGLSAFFIDLDLEKVTQEFRLASPSDARVEWLIGAFYTDEKSSNEQLLTAQAFSGASIAGLDPLFVGSIPSKYKEYAAFGGVTVHVTDRFEVAAGLRYARNEQSFRQVSSGSLVATTDTPGDSAENVTTYSVSSSFHFNDDVMVYGRLATGYQPGGPNVVLSNVPPSYESSTLTNYEAGLKSDLWERRARLNISAFQIDWSDIQIGATNAQGFSFFSNGGTARSRGVETEASIRITDGFSLSATAAYTDATLTADAPSVGGRAGDRLSNIPRWSGSLRADYTQTVSGDWTAHGGVGVRMVQERYSAVTHSRYSFRMPGYNAVDLFGDVSNDRWTFRLFAKNITNERAYLGHAVLTDGLTGQAAQLLGAVLQPRTVGVAMDVSF